MMRIYKVYSYIPLFFLSLFLICSSSINIDAKASSDLSSDTNVDYTVTKNDKYSLYVNVCTGGTLYDGTQRIQEETSNIYQVSVGTKKVFHIKANTGYRVKSILYEKPEQHIKMDITNQMRNDQISITTESTMMILQINFEKINNTTASLKVNSKKDSIQTSDDNNTNLYWAILIWASILLIVLREKKQTKDSYDTQ